MREKFLKIILLSIFLPAILILLVVLISNLILPPPEFDEDLHSIRNKFMNNHFDRYFIPSSQSDDVSETERLLLKMDNRKIEFKKKPEENVYRIIALGCSTTQGWPFHMRVSYPDFLRKYLEELLPEKKIEVINLGLNGTDALISLSVMKEAVLSAPNLVIVDLGNSESWSHSARIGGRAAVTRIQGFLRKNVRAYAHIENMVPRTQLSEEEKIRLIREQKEPDMDLLEKLFLKNLDKINRLAIKNDIGIVFLTQVGEGSTSRNRLNQAIRRFGQEKNIEILDVVEHFKNSGIDERDLILPDAMHPTAEGYLEMAYAVVSGLYEKNLVTPPENWRWERISKKEDYLNEFDLTREYMEDIYTTYGLNMEYMRESFKE
ncbi:MAG: hypothetical protein GX817_03985 [Elusimicrobia bacterium]|nr:hypothetical protein [Elusimicrobiota bacterium]